MKKLVMFAALAAVTLVACEKDEDDSTGPGTNSQLIVGTWTSVLIESSTYDNTNSDTTYSLSIPGPFLTVTFEADGTFKTQSLGDTAVVTGAYTLNGNTLLAHADGDTIGGEISTLTSSKLAFDNSMTYTEDSISYTDYASFEFQK